MPFLPPSQQRQSTEGKTYMHTLHTSLYSAKNRENESDSQAYVIHCIPLIQSGMLIACCISHFKGMIAYFSEVDSTFNHLTAPEISQEEKSWKWVQNNLAVENEIWNRIITVRWCIVILIIATFAVSDHASVCALKLSFSGDPDFWAFLFQWKLHLCKQIYIRQAVSFFCVAHLQNNPQSHWVFSPLLYAKKESSIDAAILRTVDFWGTQ